jgi:hypothetical protein
MVAFRKVKEAVKQLQAFHAEVENFLKQQAGNHTEEALMQELTAHLDAGIKKQ